MSNFENELLAAGFTPVPLDIEGVVAFTGWIAPPKADYCDVCGCNAADCGGPLPGELGVWNPDTIAIAEERCGCYDPEMCQPICEGAAND